MPHILERVEKRWGSGMISGRKRHWKIPWQVPLSKLHTDCGRQRKWDCMADSVVVNSKRDGIGWVVMVRFPISKIYHRSPRNHQIIWQLQSLPSPYAMPSITKRVAYSQHVTMISVTGPQTWTENPLPQCTCVTTTPSSHFTPCRG